jgi:MFS family permease
LGKNPFSELPREVSVLSAVAFFVAVGFGLIIPAVPIFAASFGVSKTAIGLIISSFAIMRFSSGLISGKLVDRFGERTVLGFGLFMVSFFTLLTALSQSYGQLLTFRTLGGLGSSMFSVSAGSLLMRSVSDDYRARAQSLYNGGFLVGGVAGPAFGGILSGISLRAPFFVYSILLFCSGLVALFFLKGDSIGVKKQSQSDVAATTIREALAMPAYRIALVLAFIGTWVFFGMRASILPVFVTEELNSTTAIVGYGFAISAIVQGAILLKAGRFSDQRGRRAASIVGANIVFVGVLILTFSLNAWMFLLSMIVLGFGGAFLSTTPASMVGDVIKGKGGKVIAIFQMAGDAGMIFGPIIIGWISDVHGYRAAFGFSAAVFLIALVLVYQIPETRKVEGPQVNNLKPLDEDL